MAKRLRMLWLSAALLGLSACTLGGELDVTVVSNSAIRITLKDSSSTRDGCLGVGSIQRTERLDGPLVDGPPTIEFDVRPAANGQCLRTVVIDGSGQTELISGTFPLRRGSYRVFSSFGGGSAWGEFEIS